MGVQQFLQKVLDSAGRKVDLVHYHHNSHNNNNNRRLRIGVDISGWIYKATKGHGDILGDERHLDNYGRAELLRLKETTGTTEQELKLQRFLHAVTKYVLDKLSQLQRVGDILIVLDGATPPIKREQVQDRAKKRRKAIEQRDAAVSENNLEERHKGFRQAGAGEHYGKVLDAIIDSLRQEQIPFLVAPYEADGQLAFLSLNRYIDVIITEDSDLVAYGGDPILYKSDKDNPTQGILLRQEDLGSAFRELELTDFSQAMLAVLFVATGSDYCPSLKGIGIKSACDIVRSSFYGTTDTTTPSLQKVLTKLFQSTWQRDDLTPETKAEFEKRFLSAILMYRHAVIYNPIQNRCEAMRPNGDPELLSYPPYADLWYDTGLRSSITGTVRPSPLSTFVAEGWISPRNIKVREFAKLPDYVSTYLAFGKLPSASDDDEEATVDKQSEDMTADAIETQDDVEAMMETQVEVLVEESAVVLAATANDAMDDDQEAEVVESSHRHSDPAQKNMESSRIPAEDEVIELDLSDDDQMQTQMPSVLL